MTSEPSLSIAVDRERFIVKTLFSLLTAAFFGSLGGHALYALSSYGH